MSKLLTIIVVTLSAVVAACGPLDPGTTAQAVPAMVATAAAPSPTPAPTPACPIISHFAGQGSTPTPAFTAHARATITWSTNSGTTPKTFKVTGAAYNDQFWTWALEQQGKHSLTMSNPAGCYQLQWVPNDQGSTVSKPVLYPAPSAWTFDIS